MNIIKIKPLSVNDSWQGRRFKTKKYKDYESWILGDPRFPQSSLLPSSIQIPRGPITLHLEFGFSNKASDWDNPIKPFVDILQKRYGFNDNRIYRAVVEKKIVPKGQEYIAFKLSKYSEK